MDYWNLYHLLMLIGAAQGLFMGIWLMRSQGQANRFLAVILFFLAYRLIVEFLRSSLVGQDHWAYYVLLEYNWVYGCLLYFYVRSYLEPGFQLNKKDWVHFLPVVLEFLFSTWVKLQNVYWDGSAESLPWLGAPSYVLWMHTPFSLIVACLLIFGYVRKAQQWIGRYSRDMHRPIPSAHLAWLRQILLGFQLFSLVVMFTSVVDYFFFDLAFDPWYRFPTYIGMAALTYWLALQGFARRNEPPLREVRVQELPEGVNWDQLAQALERLMEEKKAYQDPELKLHTLAERLQVKPYQLTLLLNRRLEQSFTEYVQSYRVQAFQAMLLDPDKAAYTLMALAFEAGFNSKATFNRVVKKWTGFAPRQLREQALLNTNS